MSYINELVQNLRNGCVQSPKRWSGDCGEMSRVDERETDALMNQAAAELNMTEERMWIVIRNMREYGMIGRTNGQQGKQTGARSQ